MLALSTFLDFFTPPDPALRQPFTGAAFFPFFFSCYAMAVLVILPHTFILRLSLLPFVLWQGWTCAVSLNFPVGLALYLGVKNGEWLNYYGFTYVVRFLLSVYFFPSWCVFADDICSLRLLKVAVTVMTLRSIEWAFARKPFRRYEPFKEGQHTLVERPLTVPNIILDAFDLHFNHRGIRWSWGSKSFLRTRPPPPSLAAVVFKLLLKLTVYDIALYIIQRTRPSVFVLPGDTLFDPHLDPVPRTALAAFLALCGAFVMYTGIDTTYHIATLIGRVLLQQPAADWPALSARPWTATSIVDLWSFRWHQFFRHVFVVFGARPGGALLGQPGALLGAFGVSAVLHYVGMWGLGWGTEFSGAGGFFVLMGVGAGLERVWQRTTGMRVGGFWGWAWTMSWTLFWGTFMLDMWARHGLLALPFAVAPAITAASQHLSGNGTLESI
ncbi:hypothetical protein EDB85DRAFT_585567 [Lactarius pseudohatsudake]|nr:hypothetical protein EDB85DRAFT_585567 [Lactarius pseudohatsudake]